MILALDAREHFFNVVEAADQARSAVEASGLERFARWARSVCGVKARAQDIVHKRFERDAPFSPLALQPHRNVVIERQRGTHIVMLSG